MAQKEQEVLVSSEAGLGAAIGVESGPDLGDVEEVKARGYWELVWILFRRDKVAIASGIFIILLILTAFVGAPLAKRVLGHGPNAIFIGTQALSPDLQPAGPWTHVTYTDP